MKLLYLTFQEDAPLYLGVVRKIKWQAQAFEELGYDVTYSLFKGDEYSFFTGGHAESYRVGAGRKMRRFAQIAREYLAQNPCGLLYMRIDRLSFDLLRLCGLAKRMGARRVILEQPNYPYLMDYVRCVNDVKPFSRFAAAKIKVLLTALQDRAAGLFLRGAADAVVMIGNPVERFFGVPVINILNGVNVDAMALVPQKEARGELVFIGVAGTLWWQAYDRVLEGMAAYHEAHPGGTRFKFILVGGDAKEMAEFHAMVERYSLADSVETPGFLRGDALEEMYARADLGVSKLGCYRRGLTSCSSLKAREYCAKGLPFLHSCENLGTSDEPPFALRVPNNPTPIDMERVLAFMAACRAKPGLPMQEREFARKHFSWAGILKEVLDFAEK